MAMDPERAIFDRFTRWTEHQLGRSGTFALAFLSIVLWGVTGPFFGWSDTWQLVINTGTTIVTFLMVFIIQNTQNRDARAINLKLNELIRAIDKARDQMIDIENLSDLELQDLHSKYEQIRAACIDRQKRKEDVVNPLDRSRTGHITYDSPMVSEAAN